MVQPADRPAAGPDGVDVDHRHLDRPPADLAAVGSPHAAGFHHADVAGGAAHVEPDCVAVPRERRQQRGSDRAARRSREDAPGPRALGLARRDEAAGGAHQRRLGQAALAGHGSQTAEVAAEERGEVGVDHRGRAALVLAELGQDLVRDRHVDARQLGAEVLGDRALVGGLEVGEQQADRDRLGARLADRLGEPRGLPVAKRLDRAGRADPLGCTELCLGGDEGPWLRRARAVELRAGSGGRSPECRRSRASRRAPCGHPTRSAARWCPRSSRARRLQRRTARHRRVPGRRRSRR